MSSRRVSSVKVAAVQAVDVAMFASGYFKVIKTRPGIYQIFSHLFFSSDVKYLITHYSYLTYS